MENRKRGFMLHEKLRELELLYVKLEEARGDVGMAQRALEASYQYAYLQECKMKQREIEKQIRALAAGKSHSSGKVKPKARKSGGMREA